MIMTNNESNLPPFPDQEKPPRQEQGNRTREQIAALWQEHGGRIEVGIFAVWIALAGIERYRSWKAKKN